MHVRTHTPMHAVRARILTIHPADGSKDDEDEDEFVLGTPERLENERAQGKE